MLQHVCIFCSKIWDFTWNSAGAQSCLEHSLWFPACAFFIVKFDFLTNVELIASFTTLSPFNLVLVWLTVCTSVYNSDTLLIPSPSLICRSAFVALGGTPDHFFTALSVRVSSSWDGCHWAHVWWAWKFWRQQIIWINPELKLIPHHGLLNFFNALNTYVFDVIKRFLIFSFIKEDFSQELLYLVSYWGNRIVSHMKLDCF